MYATYASLMDNYEHDEKNIANYTYCDNELHVYKQYMCTIQITGTYSTGECFDPAQLLLIV